MSRLELTTGKVFGRWFAIKRVANRGGRRYWLCRCSCGTLKTILGANLHNGRSRSCGCLVGHGHAHVGNQSPEYRAWQSMKARCTYPNRECWKNYGGRGIRVCDRWLGEQGFQNFLTDMGPKPEPKKLYSLDRFPDNNGDYTPSNCRWATRKEQNLNRRYCVANPAAPASASIRVLSRKLPVKIPA